MALTVISAFNKFLADTVNLDPQVSTRARSSREWLRDQIRVLPDKTNNFPPLYSEMDLYYGSFARRTKIRELDDVDMIVCLSARGTTYIDSGGTLMLIVPDGITLRGLCHEGY